MSNLSTEHLRGGTIIKCSFLSKMYAKLKKVWWNLSLIICLMHEMLSCRVVLEHSMTGHKYCGPTSMPTRNTSRSQWRSQKFFSGRRGGTHMTGMWSERKGAGKATHYICLLFVPFILPQQWQYDSRCPFPPFQSKKPEQEAELRSWKTCNMQQCDDQAGNDLKVVGRCSRLQQYGKTPFPYRVPGFPSACFN